MRHKKTPGLIQIRETGEELAEDVTRPAGIDGMDDTSLHSALLEQPVDVLFPAASQLSPGFAEAGWRAAMQASNEHLIPRALTLGFKAPLHGDMDAEALLDALLICLRLNAAALADDREVAAMVLQPGIAEQLPAPLLGRLLDAVPEHLRIIARPQVEVRVDASTRIQPEDLRRIGSTRLTVIDRAGAAGPQLLARGQRAGYTACYYQLSLPLRDDPAFLERMESVLALAPERILLPAPCASTLQAVDPSAWLQAWRLLQAAGYLPLGGDHYQRPGLELPVRSGEGQRYCDLLGVPRRERHDLLGIGPGACSQIGNVICRTEPSSAQWRDCLAAGQPGVAAGLILSEQECLVDEVIQSLACDHALDMRVFEWHNALPFDGCFEAALDRIAPFMQCGWVRREDNRLLIENEGRLLWRIIAACFLPTA